MGMLVLVQHATHEMMAMPSKKNWEAAAGKHSGTLHARTRMSWRNVDVEGDEEENEINEDTHTLDEENTK